MGPVDDRASRSGDRSSGDAIGEAPLRRATGVDPLSDVLRNVRLTGALFFLWDVSSPFATPIPSGDRFAPILLPGAQQIASYHAVVEGSCWGAAIGGSPVRLQAGDVLLVPRGDAYVIADSAERCRAARVVEAPSLEFFGAMAAGELPFRIVDGGGGPQRARLVCGFLGCDVRPFNPAVVHLPAVVRVRPAREGADARLPGLVEHALAEARDPGPGSETVLVRLGELMFVDVLRRCLDEQPAARGWLAGLRDPVVARCLELMHRRPSESWTLERLGLEVGSSRSGLAQRFADRVGETPIRYLTRWRLQLGASLLADGSLSVAAIAHRVGYGSGEAFSRAFQREVGTTPSEWRHRRVAIADG